MEIYVIQYDTNYGTSVMIIKSSSELEAKEIALKNGAWDNLDCHKLDDVNIGLIYKSDDNGNNSN